VHDDYLGGGLKNYLGSLQIIAFQIVKGHVQKLFILTQLLFVRVQVMGQVWLSLSLPFFQEIKTRIERQC
jgi:hypothetical protein